MGLRGIAVLGCVGVLLCVGVGFAAEPVTGAANVVAAETEEAKPVFVDVEVRIYKNDVQVSKPSMQTLSGRPIDMAMQARDKDGVSSHIIVDVVPVVVGDGVAVKGEVAVALADGAKEKVVVRVDETVKGDEVIRVPVALQGDKYVLEFRFGVVK